MRQKGEVNKHLDHGTPQKGRVLGKREKKFPLGLERPILWLQCPSLVLAHSTLSCLLPIFTFCTLSILAGPRAFLSTLFKSWTPSLIYFNDGSFFSLPVYLLIQAQSRTPPAHLVLTWAPTWFFFWFYFLLFFWQFNTCYRVLHDFSLFCPLSSFPHSCWNHSVQ